MRRSIWNRGVLDMLSVVCLSNDQRILSADSQEAVDTVA